MKILDIDTMLQDSREKEFLRNAMGRHIKRVRPKIDFEPSIISSIHFRVFMFFFIFTDALAIMIDGVLNAL
jgi:hypothetical protein